MVRNSSKDQFIPDTPDTRAVSFSQWPMGGQHSPGDAPRHRVESEEGTPEGDEEAPEVRDWQVPEAQRHGQ
eukprot:5244889-Pyramimonas_sp.AAC.1